VAHRGRRGEAGNDDDDDDHRSNFRKHLVLAVLKNGIDTSNQIWLASGKCHYLGRYCRHIRRKNLAPICI
jgi:hypothetical protein